MEHIDWIPSKWATGTQGMTPVQKGIYMDIINQIYLVGEPVLEDHTHLAGVCGARLDVFRKTLDQLIEMGKIHRVVKVEHDNNLSKFHNLLPQFSHTKRVHLMANHCPQELEACSGRIERSRKNGAKGGRPPKKTETYETQQVNGQKTQQVSEDLGKNNLWVCNNTKLNRTSPKGPDQSSGQGNEATEIPIAGLIDLKACLQTFPGLEPSPSAIAPASEAAGRPVVASDGVAGGMTGGGAVLLTSEPEIGAQVASIADRAPHLAADGLPFPDPGSRAAGTNPRANGTSLRQRGSACGQRP